MIHQNLDMTMKMKMTRPVFENLNLSRYPLTSDPNLKAWNAADEYLIESSGAHEISQESNVLVVNDQFGAITCALYQATPDLNLINWTDSFLSKFATNKNVKANYLAIDIKFFSQYQSRLDPKLMLDYIFIRVPKHNSLLEFQLETLCSHINDATIVIAAGMTKEIHNSTIALFEKIIGPTKTSLAKKKARLIYARVAEDKLDKNQEERATKIKQFELKEFGVTSYGYPGDFSRDKLDLGCRVLLKYLPNTLNDQKLIDLGCGTGILGTVAAKQNKNLRVVFSDESFLAIQSAKKTFAENVKKSAAYHVTNVLDDIEENDFDHILCNPPFHQQNVQTLSIANKMFKQSAQKLKSTGELRVVANRHLNYKPMLGKYFEKVRMLSNDPKFVVWLATSPKGNITTNHQL